METEKTKAQEGTLVYEASYLLLPSLAESEIPAKAASIKEAVGKAGGEVISNEDPILIDLAYPMTKVIHTVRHKASSGYFGWVKFEIGTDGLAEVKKFLDNSDDVLRYLLVKTVRENTLLHGKMMFHKEESIKKAEAGAETDAGAEGEVEATAEPVSIEEMDKSIDGLVIE